MRPAARPTRYGMAVASSMLALLLELALDPFTTPASSLPLSLTAIVISAWYGGLGPALLATLLSSLGLVYFLLPPSSHSN